MTNRSVSSRVYTKTLILSIAAGSIALGGCSRHEDAKEAVAQAGSEFRKVSVGDATLSESLARDAYTQAGDSVSEFAGSDSPYGEAAAVSLALSKLGMATLAEGDASKAETEAIHKSRLIRAYLSEWFAMNAVAMASTNFDISDEKRSLQELIELRRDDVAQHTKLLETHKREIATLNEQIEILESKVITERNESARNELQMTAVSATQAAQLAERVREHSLRADNYELEAERIGVMVGQLLPGAHEVELQVKKAMDQIELLELSIDELDQRVRDSKADSAQARANAQQAQTSVTTLVEELESYRSDTVDPANQKVLSLIRDALNAARDARDAAKASGSLTKASASEQLGRAYARMARGQDDMVSLYESIAASGIPGDWDSMVAEHTQTRDDLYDQSRQSYQDGASALRSVRARGETKDRLEAAAVRLDRLGGVEPEPEYNEDYDSEDSGSDDSASDDVDG